MPLLPARIPEIPEARSEVVPARLARKVGPLFGVPWDEGPFGHRTWVSDYSRITLSEIARGAPLPTRGRTTQADGDGPWVLADRVGIARPGGGLPHEIANATLNRFGPDTKAAVLLTAVNQLLDPIRQAVQDVLPFLVDNHGGELEPELRLAAWAALIVETFRSQPALVTAGIKARAIQRELMTPWQLPLAPSLATVPLTRCEISAPARTASPSRPSDLHVVDATFSALDIDRGSGDALTRRLRHDELVDRLLRPLQAAGTLQDASHLWLSMRRPEELVVEALVPPTQLTHAFAGPFATGVPALPRIPTRGDVAALQPLARRALLIALLGVLRHVQFTPEGLDRTRAEVVAAAGRLAELAGSLPAGDPVRVVSRCRTALIIVDTLRHDTANDLSTAVPELLAATDDAVAAGRAGVLDRGAAAEIISAANIAVNAVRRINATGAGAGLPSPAELDKWLRRSWAAYLAALEVDPASLVDPDPNELGLIGYHLHTYAAFLAGHPESPEDVQAAERLFREVVIPARAAFHERGGTFEPLRTSLQVSTRATVTLAAAARDAGDIARAREWAETGLQRIRTAMDDPATRALLDTPTDNASRFALLAAPALLLALELDAPGANGDDAGVAARLVDLVRRWEARSLGEGQASRHSEVVRLQERLDAWTARVRASRNGPGIAAVAARR